MRNAQLTQLMQAEDLLLAQLVVTMAIAQRLVTKRIGRKWAMSRLGDFKYPVKLNFAFL